MPIRRRQPKAPQTAWTPPSRRRVRAVRDRLRRVYGRPLAQPHGEPLAELILTVLSQSTNDRNRDVAYLRLRERLPAWEVVRDVPLEEVEEAIRPGGISRVKSLRIQQILREISATALDPDHELSLDWLAHAPVDQAREYLMALPGVGRKTAACVLLFAYGRRDVPVDTHVSRVGGRLELLDAAASLERQHEQMLALTPPGEELELHLNLLRHGRRTCRARAPDCPGCVLARICPSRDRFVGQADAARQPRGSTAKAMTA